MKKHHWIGAVIVCFVIGYASFEVRHYRCVTGARGLCVYESPYDDVKRVGYRLCSKNGWWSECHPKCESK